MKNNRKNVLLILVCVALLGVLAEDPRPSYQDDPERVYGMSFAGLEVKFTVAGDKLHIVEIQK